jgi:hypothetical protein
MENTKTHWKKLENPDYIGAYSIPENSTLTVKITKVVREMVTGTGGKKEECTVAYLENQKPFILNRTNMKVITKLYNTPYIEEWSGKMIILYVAKVRAFGEDNVEALRIKTILPIINLPELKKTDTVNYEKVVAAVKNGYKIDQIKTKWKLSKDVESELLKQMDNGNI